MRQHLTDSQVDRYVGDGLATDALAEVEEHLLTCTGCRARVLESEELISCFRAAAQLGARPAPARLSVRIWRDWGIRLPIAAAAAVATIVFAVRFPAPQEPPPEIVALRTLRGPEAPAHIRSGRTTILIFDVDSAVQTAPHVVEVVDRTGRLFNTMTPEVKDGRLTLSIRDLPRGAYWVRLYREHRGDEPISEYGLQVD